MTLHQRASSRPVAGRARLTPDSARDSGQPGPLLPDIAAAHEGHHQKMSHGSRMLRPGEVVAQRSSRLGTEQEDAGSNPAGFALTTTGGGGVADEGVPVRCPAIG